MPAPPPANRAISDDELLRALRGACVAAGRVLSQTAFERRRLAPASADRPAPDPPCPNYRAYRRRWGRWADVLAALGTWVAAHDPGFPLRGDLPGAARPDPPPGQLRDGPPRGLAPDYGEPINIPGMLHAPVDAAGVILLFGVLARELGFAIAQVSVPSGGRGASLRCGALSCEALSCQVTRRHGDVWERRRLTFAFASRELAGSPAAPGDLLVCWRHDWPDCPLEVIELRREAAKHA